jgi:hypothetical protein
VNLLLDHLALFLRIGAAGQFAVAMINLCIPRLMKWDHTLAEMPLLLREVFRVHVWFITITLCIFATVTWRFAAEMMTNPACRWLAGGIAIFWGIRTLLQLAFYSPSHWRGKVKETVIHLILLAAYGGLALVYGAACIGRMGG